MVKPFIPELGDIVWLDMDPQAGHEQKGRRPALVLTLKEYNKIGLALVCPITNKAKGYPFEVAINGFAPNTTGAVLADHAKSLDWVARNAALKDKADTELVNQVKEKIAILLLI